MSKNSGIYGTLYFAIPASFNFHKIRFINSCFLQNLVKTNVGQTPIIYLHILRSYYYCVSLSLHLQISRAPLIKIVIHRLPNLNADTRIPGPWTFEQ